MKDESLNLLSKKELIKIIKSDPTWKAKASMHVIEMVHRKVNDIIDEQEKCDIRTQGGRLRYMELEKEYQKWSKIQANL